MTFKTGEVKKIEAGKNDEEEIPDISDRTFPSGEEKKQVRDAEENADKAKIESALKYIILHAPNVLLPAGAAALATNFLKKAT